MSEKINYRKCTAFVGERMIAAGDAATVALAMRAAIDRGASHVLAFEDETGRQVDFDLRGTDADIRARLADTMPEPTKPGRGRPKLGVTAREVTLLPRHWEWLAQQPGGASATLRRLVDQARKASSEAQAPRLAQDAAFRLMSALAGDLPGFEDATRALFAGDYETVGNIIGRWPKDIAAYIGVRLAVAAECGDTVRGD